MPFIWSEFYPKSTAEHSKELAQWERKDPASRGQRPKPRMQEKDADNFLKFATALKIILARTVRPGDIPRAKQLLFSYLKDFFEVSKCQHIYSYIFTHSEKMHKEHIKPNHHWCTHLFDQVLDYGPVYGFWSFTYERLNKVLKSYHTNNHGGGEIEVTFFRSFTREARIYDIVRSFFYYTLSL